MMMTPKNDNAHWQVGEVANQTKQHPHINPGKPIRQPLRGISAYERLRGEFIAINPVHTEAELLAACVVFARACGLILREKILQHHLQEAGCHDAE